MKKIWLFCFLSLKLFGQTQIPAKYFITTLSADDGLSQVSNYFRFEDSRGFMWITAADALNRFDGSTVKVFNLKKYFKECEPLQQGYGFAEDDKANIYIGSEKGLYIYDRNEDIFKLKKIFKNAEDDIAMPFAFYENKIWCFNRFYEIATFDLITQQIELRVKLPAEPLKSINVYQNPNNVFFYRWPFIDKNGSIWVTAPNRIIKFNFKSKAQKIFPAPKNQHTLYASAYDETSQALVVGTNAGIFCLDLKTEQIKTYNNLKGFILQEVNALSVKNNFIAFKNNSSLYFLDLNKMAYRKVTHLETQTRAFIAFSFDKMGRLWITDNGLDQKIFNFKTRLLNKFPDEITKTSNSNNSIGYINEKENHDIQIQDKWVLNNRTKDIIEKKNGNKLARGFQDNFSHGIWYLSISRPFETLFFEENKSRKITFKLNSTEFNKIGVLQDLDIFKDQKILLAGSNGLYWLDKKNNKLILANDEPNTFKINELGPDLVGISYLNRNLILYQKVKDKLVKLKNILPGIQSFYIQKDSLRNQFWVGSNDGIYLLNKKFSVVKHFNADLGLAGTFIYGLLLDDEGNVWASHQQGLSSIDAKDHSIINYDKQDGIQGLDFNNRSFLKATDGTLYFGGTNGVNYFKPPLQPHVFYKPEVYIDEILINQAPFKSEKSVNLLNALNLSHTENNISIKALIKDLERGNSLKIIYRLNKGPWLFGNPKSNITFNNLASGHYLLELGIFDKLKNTKEVSKKLEFDISTPFYNSILFWLITGILFTGLGTYIFNKQKSKAQIRTIEQKLALEKQRLKITADLHDDLGATLSSLQVNSSVASQLLDKDLKKAKEVINKIEDQSKKISENLNDLVWSLKPGEEEFMDFGTKIKNFVNDILGSTGIIYTINISKELNESLVDINIRKNLIFITKEIINNAAKYSKASTIGLDSTIKNNNIILKIADNGQGFDKEKVLGNGLINIKKRVKDLNGSFKLTTEINKGCSIYISIPLSPDLGTKS